MLDESILNLQITVLLLIGTFIFILVSIKRKELFIYLPSYIILPLGYLFIYLQIFDYTYRLVGNLLFLISILAFIFAVYYEYFKAIQKNHNKTSKIPKKRKVILSLSPITLLIMSIQIIFSILLLIAIFMIINLFFIKKSAKHASLIIFLVSALLSGVSTILSHFKLPGVWEFSFVAMIIFCTSYFIFPIIVYLEEQLITSEVKLRESEKKYRELINNISDVILELDEQANFTYTSPQVFELFGYKQEEMIGLNALSFIHPEDLPKVVEIMKKAIITGKTYLFEFRNRHGEGHYITVSLKGRAIKEEGKIKFIGLMRDITEYKKAEQNLKESEEKYRKAYNLTEFYKDIFAHDISNILQNILTATELCSLFLEDSKKPKEIEHAYEIILSQVKRGASLVSTVRKLSILETKDMVLNKIELSKVLKESIQNIQNNFSKSEIKFKIETQEKKFYIKANDLVQDIFENILNNAVTYNNSPIVEILIKISKEQEQNIDYIKVQFIDNGIGISDARKKEIFERTERNIGGIGLGLTLVKKAIKSFNGKIWIEDKTKGDYSKGSNFIILLPEGT